MELCLAQSQQTQSWSWELDHNKACLQPTKKWEHIFAFALIYGSYGIDIW